jgi:hypothetical protein
MDEDAQEAWPGVRIAPSGCSDSIASASGFGAPPATTTVAGLKPCFHAMIIYILAGIFLNLNLPCISVVEWPIALLLFDLSSSLTSASGRPSASVIAPVIVLVPAGQGAAVVAFARMASSEKTIENAALIKTFNPSTEVAYRSSGAVLAKRAKIGIRYRTAFALTP